MGEGGLVVSGECLRTANHCPILPPNATHGAPTAPPTQPLPLTPADGSVVSSLKSQSHKHILAPTMALAPGSLRPP